MHIKGAINLSFPDIAVDSLKKTLPDKSARILIYCNNNFKNAEEPFPTKKPRASLNLSTYIALYTLRLPEHLRAGSADRPEGFEAAVRVQQEVIGQTDQRPEFV